MHGKKPGREFSMYGGTAMQKQPGENTVHMSYEIMTSLQQLFPESRYIYPHRIK